MANLTLEHTHQTREDKIVHFQRLLEEKYPHADYVNNGGTQIAGMAVHTPSMTADSQNPGFFKNASTILAKGAPAIRGSVDPMRTFRLS